METGRYNSQFCQFQVIVICIPIRAVSREKLSPKPRQGNLEDFVAKVYKTFFVPPKIFNYYKMNK
jgi:hypothetical protein